MIASHFVLADIASTIASGNMAEAEKIFKKFARRYHGDRRLQELFREFERYLDQKNQEVLEDVTKRLTELRACRRLESSGGGALPLRDRRHLASVSDREV